MSQAVSRQTGSEQNQRSSKIPNVKPFRKINQSKEDNEQPSIHNEYGGFDGFTVKSKETVHDNSP